MEGKLYQQFKVAAEGVGAEVYRVEGPEQALELITGILREWESRKRDKRLQVVWKKGSITSGLATKPAIKGIIYEKELSFRAREADVGIAEGDLAIADTGTIVQDATDVEKRYVTTLPELNILLVRTTAIVADMEEAFARLRPGRIPFLAFITGPSRTADIERVLTLGVHGPEWLHVICVDEGGSRNGQG
ncbi:MAG: LUD domain-containing protein [Clostridia bacterium]|jgi:L-lactate dehydrogenase complex protein LldG|nr:LUD domain-containing protein [Clostridia bacterium]